VIIAIIFTVNFFFLLLNVYIIDLNSFNCHLTYRRTTDSPNSPSCETIICHTDSQLAAELLACILLSSKSLRIVTSFKIPDSFSGYGVH
jgi:hypothetical protein